MTTERDSSDADARLPNRWAHAFAGACVACVGLAFFFLDRQYGDIGAATLPWLIATLLGFGTGAAMLDREGPAGRAMCAVLGFVGLALAVFPTFQIYSLIRWLALCLLFVGIARAPLLRSRRDLYFSLTTCFVATSVVAIHARADWLLWCYLGPACLFAGLALTMEHVATHAVGIAAKLTASALFVGGVVLLASLMFFWLPRPPVLGFGFLPPPASQRTLAPVPAGPPADATGSGAAESSSSDGAGAAAQDSSASWQQMLQRMRSDLRDPTIPGWQRTLLGRLLDVMEALVSQHAGGQASQVLASASATGDDVSSASVRIVVRIRLVPLLAWFALLALAALGWWQRRRLASTALALASWSLTRIHPLGAMKMSARMMAVGISRLGAPSPRARTLREQVALTRELPPLARRWYDEALDLYHAARFGRLLASAAHARSMRLTVQDATELALDARRDQSLGRVVTAMRGTP